jgi:hypothetical protein
MGPPGPHRGQGGKFLILPPGYEEADLDGLVPKGVYTFAESRSYAVWVLLRGFLKDGKPDYASKLFRDHIKIYPLSTAADPPKMEFIAGTGKNFNTVHAANYHFFEELHTVIDREPIEFLDPELRGLFASIGIQKGKNNKRGKLITNDDGSIDLFFGPKAPKGKEANWIQTVPQKGWFCLLRLYSPTEAWFDKTWRPGEIERVK